MGLVDFVLGHPHSDGADGSSSGEGAFPRPIAFMEALKAAMRDRLLDVTEDRALVPAHYTVLLHTDAYRYLEPAFPVITEATGEELSKEVDRLSRIPYGAPLDGASPSRRRGADAEEPPVCRDIRPMDPSWSVEFVPVLYSPDGERVTPDYLAVATRLTASGAPEVVAQVVEGNAGEVPLSVTVLNPFSGAYESRPAAASIVRPVEHADGVSEGVTLRAPFAPLGERGAPIGTPPAGTRDVEPQGDPLGDPFPPGTLATLHFKYPGSPEEHVFAMTEPHVVVGRKTPTNEAVHLRLDVDVQVSAEHAHLRSDREAGRFEIMDVSSFGTWVDEAPLTRSDPANGVEHWHPLRDGATINLAGLLFLTFRSAIA